MASSYSSSVTASQVGSYFVQQYYQVLQQQPDFVHQFYTDSSTMVRVDGESTDNASAVFQIHTLIQSFHFTAIEIKTINALESWSQGIVVVVTGSVRSKYFTGWRKFGQTFFLAPQEKGYFVLNDIFQFVTEEITNHLPPPLATGHKDDFQQLKSTSQELSACGGRKKGRLIGASDADDPIFVLTGTPGIESGDGSSCGSRQIDVQVEKLQKTVVNMEEERAERKKEIEALEQANERERLERERIKKELNDYRAETNKKLALLFAHLEPPHP